MRILFIPDSRGQGHEVRCGALADVLEKRGHQCDMGGPRIVPVSGLLYDAVVIDLKNDIGMASAIKHTIRIIDDPEGQKGAADLTVLGSAGKDPRVVGAYALIGPEYALLRPQFRVDPIARADTVLDARHMTGWSASDMAVQMSRASVVITYGGMRAMEAACVGAPMVLIPRNRGEKLNADGLAAAYCGVISTESECGKAAAYMLRQPAMLEEMSRAGRALVDGRGCERVADEIEAMVSA